MINKTSSIREGIMVYKDDAHLKDDKMERMFLELRLTKLNQKERYLINHLERWMKEKGFLTPKQFEALQGIYTGASNGKR